MSHNFLKTVATTLVALVICLSINTAFSVAHEIEEAGFAVSHTITIAFLHVDTPGHCPACPTDDHPGTDHNHSSCDHHTYMSLAAQTDYQHPAQIPLPHVSLDKSQFIPEVFLDIFVPPQSLA